MRKFDFLAPLVVGLACIGPPSRALAASPAHSAAEMDRDLLEVTIPQLQKLYAQHKYTVTQVVEWHLARIDRSNGIYRAVETVLR